MGMAVMRKRRRALPRLLTSTLCLFVAVIWAPSFHAQSESGGDCKDDITAFDGYKFHSVKVRARYLPDLPHPLPSPGTAYSPATVTRIVEDVHQVLTKEANRESEAGETELKLLKTVSVGAESGIALGVKVVTSCAKVVREAECERDLGKGNSRCVDVTIHALSVRVDTANPLANLLNIPRSSRPSFLSNVPGPLLAFNPRIGLEQDAAFGPAGKFEIASNLLDLPRNMKSLPLQARRTRLDLEANGRRSFDGPFYNTAARLSLSRSFADSISHLAIEAGFSADHDPRGTNEYLRNAATIGADIKLRTAFDLIEEVAVLGRYRWSRNRFASQSGLRSDSTSENSLDASAVFSGRLWHGVSRIGFWADANSPNNNRKNYRRVAGLWGYQREFLTIPNQTVGVEALLGVGRVWGTVPQYARFYGGNSPANFLYEARDSPALRALPVGPVLRSFGSGQFTAANGIARGGGTSYWNLSLNVTIPVPGWSSPLVPDISIELPTRDANGHAIVNADGDPVMEERPLRDILKNQGESSRKVLERLFRKEGLSLEEAQSKARRELKSINSILGFIADQANIYSVKPLFMFDVARLNAPEGDSQNRFGLGGGLQFTIVIAKFEAGYMRTLSPQPGDKRGNFVMRLIFQNLF